MRIVLPILLAAILAAAAQAATVGTDHGRVVVNGKAITSGGRDFDPVLSPDGKRVVFRHLTGGAPLEDCAADATATKAQELWSVDAQGTGAAKLLTLKSDPDVKKTLCAFDNLQFSSDGRLLYFETPAWATSGAVHVYDFKTRRERYLMPGNGLKVLTNCHYAPYRDDLIVSQHRYFVFSGSYDWSFLFTPDGKEVGPLGEGDFSQDLDDRCG